MKNKNLQVNDSSSFPSHQGRPGGAIEVVFNHEKKRLTIFKDGKPVCGYVGDIAVKRFKSIAFNNAKITVKDADVQPAV